MPLKSANLLEKIERKFQKSRKNLADVVYLAANKNRKKNRKNSIAAGSGKLQNLMKVKKVG